MLVTGGTGSWGHERVSQIIDDSDIGEIIIYSCGEDKQVEMKIRFSAKLRFFADDFTSSLSSLGPDDLRHLSKREGCAVQVSRW